MAVLGDARPGRRSASMRAGDDYHDVVKKRLKRLGRWLVAETGAEIKVFVDTAPVMEKPLAQAAGLGWQGKHTNLLVARARQLVLPRGDLHDAGAAARRAGRGALRLVPGLPRRLPDRGVSGAVPARCAAVHLLPDDRARRAGGRGVARRCSATAIYGCDDCLAVCPWNKFAADGARGAATGRARRWRRRGWPSWRRWTTRGSGRCSAARRSSASGANRFVRNVALCDRELGRSGAAAGGARRRGATPTRWCATRPPGRWRGSVEALEVGAGERGERAVGVARGSAGARAPRRRRLSPVSARAAPVSNWASGEVGGEGEGVLGLGEGGGGVVLVAEGRGEERVGERRRRGRAATTRLEGGAGGRPVALGGGGAGAEDAGGRCRAARASSASARAARARSGRSAASHWRAASVRMTARASAGDRAVGVGGEVGQQRRRRCRGRRWRRGRRPRRAGAVTPPPRRLQIAASSRARGGVGGDGGGALLGRADVGARRAWPRGRRG